MYIGSQQDHNPQAITFGSLEAFTADTSMLGPIRNALAGGQWYAALALAFFFGLRAEDKLTNLLFFAQHPERGGRVLDPQEPGLNDLSKKWLAIRNNWVRPFLQKASATSDTAAKPGAPSAPAAASAKKNCVDAGECNACERRIVNAPAPRLNLVPSDLRRDPDRKRWLDATVLDAYRRLVSEARRAGIGSPYLTLVSGHRTYEEQAKLWRKRLLEMFKNRGCPEAQHTCIASAIDNTTAALKSRPLLHPRGAWLRQFLSELKRSGCTPSCDPTQVVLRLSRGTAPPGRSPHHTGRAVDLHVGGRISTDPGNVEFQHRQTAYKWLVCNAARFGFYPYVREPWHWEYNPPS